MKNINKYLLLVALLVLTGQGCVFGGEGDFATGPDGSVYFTDDQGAEWTQMTALPTVSGVSSIAGVNALAFEIDPTDNTVMYMGTEANGMVYSLDSGNTWMRPKGAEARETAVIDVEVDPNNICIVYVVKPDRILKTQDCNRTYTSITVEPRTDEQFTAFEMDWFDSNVLWAGTSAGDVLKSVDSGESWSTVHRIRDGITDLMLSNKDSRIVVVGTEDKGLWRSADSGVTWGEFEDELRREYRESDRVYGFAQDRTGDTLIMNTKYGLLESNDQGLTWKSLPLRTAPGEERIWSMALEPGNGDVIYYATKGALYTSTNGGDAWVVEELPSKRYPVEMVVHPGNYKRVFVGFQAIED